MITFPLRVTIAAGSVRVQGLPPGTPEPVVDYQFGTVTIGTFSDALRHRARRERQDQADKAARRVAATTPAVIGRSRATR